jgi:AraC family transcriptional regulator, transcriptional activator of the genes for pyochelin and ferripyochelin receptors
MKSAPLISASEFESYSVSNDDLGGMTTLERRHPDFGVWKERFIDLGNIRIFEHQAEIKQSLNIHFEEDKDDCVHHCMSLQGLMDAKFFGSNVEAQLSPLSFHSLFIPYNEYTFGIGSSITNIHLEITRDYYSSLLPDSEKWSTEIKQKLQKDLWYYTGELKLSQAMIQTIHAIFNCPLIGSLKKLLVEAKIQELIALQLQSAIDVPQPKKQVAQSDLIFSIRDHLDQSYLQPQTLKGISKHFGINEFALKKGFKKNLNTTVFDYILLKRLEHGRKLLIESNQSVQEIGSMVGYKYPNHFSAAFKKTFGVNPTELRASS